MVMRVGGLATGMDIEGIVNKLMDAERMPLVRMEQEQTKLTWKQDSFREMNRALLELEDMMFDMKLSPTYHSKTVRSSQESAVTATGSTSASEGIYNLEVTQLARNAINVGEPLVGFDPDAVLDATELKFSTFDENQGAMKEHVIEITEDETLNQVLKRITDGDYNVRAFFDTQSNRVIMETTRTGEYNVGGREIEFDDSEGSFFAEVLKMDVSNEQGGTDAVFKYNGFDFNSKNNSYGLNGINFQFHSETDGPATLNVIHDVDHSYNSTMKFVTKYNEVIDKLNGSQQEEIFRDFQPLTNDQKKEMSEDEIKKWEEKAMSGILRRESVISDGMLSMRQSWYSNVVTDGEYTSLTQIGITTSNKYFDGGKLEVNEGELRAALRENPDDVRKLFSNPVEGNSRGLVHRLDDAVKSTKSRIEERAGKGTSTLDNYTIGKRMKDLNERISSFEARMNRLETRYWNQFTQMEKAIQRMNDQSAQLFSQFGG